MRSNPVYRSLNQPQTVGGADKPMAVLNTTFAAAIMFGAHTWYYLPVAIVVHGLIKWLTRQDPWFRVVYITYNRHGDRYDPWVHEHASPRGMRPYGFARGLPC